MGEWVRYLALPAGGSPAVAAGATVPRSISPMLAAMPTGAPRRGSVGLYPSPPVPSASRAGAVGEGRRDPWAVGGTGMFGCVSHVAKKRMLNRSVVTLQLGNTIQNHIKLIFDLTVRLREVAKALMRRGGEILD